MPAEIESIEQNKTQESPVSEPAAKEGSSSSSEEGDTIEFASESSDEPLEYGLEMEVDPNKAQEALPPELSKTLFNKMIADRKSVV